MTTLIEYIASFSDRKEAEEVIGCALRLSYSELYLNPKRVLTEDELAACQCVLERKKKGEPIQYIQGEAEFYGCTLDVNPHVLIPRPETEQLVERIAEELEKIPLKGKVLWDMCTGSGCIGIALKKRFFELDVVLSDLSSDALDVARENAAKNHVDVTLLQGDLFEPFKGKKCHFFISNPPYISPEEFEGLSPEVRDFEPHEALVGGEDGLFFYRAFAEHLGDYLYPEGLVWLELGFQQGQAVKELFSQEYWRDAAVLRDYSGHERIFCARFVKNV